jgi:hypothetical protein
MIVHTLIIALQITVVAAFLILWYFWVKRRLGASLFVEDEEQVLFPFKYFSWVLIGLVAATSLAQIHFVRVSATVHERLGTLASLCERQEVQLKALESTREMIQKLRGDVDVNFRGVRSQIAEFRSNSQPAQSAGPAQATQASGPLKRPALAELTSSRDKTREKDFARAAKASHIPAAAVTSQTKPEPSLAPGSETFRMRLSRKGRILTNNLRVRKRPESQSDVVDKLRFGQQVKVTEKLLVSDKMWFRVVTPAGRQGWVDFRHVKLDRSS